MTWPIALKALAIWFAILVLAVTNGLFREAVLLPRLGTPAGLIFSGVLLGVLIVTAAYIALPWLGLDQVRALLMVGLGWLILTLAFEFSFGLWQGKPWSEILEAYTFKNGNLWPLILLVTALAPYLAAKLRGWV